MRRPMMTLFSCVLAAAAFAQEEPPTDPDESRADPIDYEKYIELLEAKYIPPAKAGDKPAIQVKFDLTPSVPKGAKVSFGFEFVGMEFDSVDYLLRDENRKGLTVLWKPEKRMGVGEYYLRVRIYPDQQTPAVQRILAQNQKSFPSKDVPWIWYFFNDPIQVGSPGDEAAEKETLCKAYTELMDKLVANMIELVDKVEEVKEGKALVKGRALDVEKFKEYVAGWRKKQGAVQQEIVEFPDKEQALFQMSITTYQNLRELGRMVSKRSVQLVKEVTEHYKVQEVINPPGHAFFDIAYRYKVTPEEMNKRMETISRQVCAKEEEAEPGEGGDGTEDPDAKKAKEAGEKEAAEKDAGAAGEEEAAEEGTEEGEAAKPKPKKKSGKKKTAK